MTEASKLQPLSISCTSTDCDNDLHCFKTKRRMLPKERGKCRSCGVDLINWERVHMRDTSDARHTFKMLKHEMIRHSFFHRSIDEKAIGHAMRKGRRKLIEAAKIRLEKYLGPREPSRDGRQTPMSGNAIFYAQHAVACCCRTCLEYWHGIPKGRALTSQELEYCLSLIELYLNQRLPDLGDDPTKVPSRRNQSAYSEQVARQ